jgi:ectoine hydroxylase-related dioxygenase (phytanoyl-CoA dioxygenase family)
MIGRRAVERYARDGYLLVPGALSGPEVARYRQAVVRRMAAWSATGDPYERVLHQVLGAERDDPELASLTRHPRLAAMARELSGMDALRVYVDQVICKPPGGSATIPHQDAPFLAFDDDRSLNCWIALDEVTVENGALSYYRGSRRHGRLPLIHLDSTDDLLVRVPELRELPLDTLVMRPGDVVFHNCLTVHRATANGTDRPRLAYSIQYMSAQATFNGNGNELLDPYAPTLGQPLDFDCFPALDGATP